MLNCSLTRRTCSTVLSTKRTSHFYNILIFMMLFQIFVALHKLQSCHAFRRLATFDPAP